jgi:hypothetical protein
MLSELELYNVFSAQATHRPLALLATVNDSSSS